MEKIFDLIRRKYVAQTPEENVRQAFIRFLLRERGFLAGLMLVEHAVTVNGTRFRCDILACNRAGQPLLLVECKAPEVAINNNTFAQAARYNMALHVPYMAVTNGIQTFCCAIDFTENKVTLLQDIPHYENIG